MLEVGFIIITDKKKGLKTMDNIRIGLIGCGSMGNPCQIHHIWRGARCGTGCYLWYICRQDYYRTSLEIFLRKIVICRLEYAITHQVENGHFDIECVAQYARNTRERLRNKLSTQAQAWICWTKMFWLGKAEDASSAKIQFITNSLRSRRWFELPIPRYLRR